MNTNLVIRMYFPIDINEKDKIAIIVSSYLIITLNQLLIFYIAFQIIASLIYDGIRY